MLLMGSGTALFAFAPTSTTAALLAATLFGSSYIGLTGLILVWSTRLYPDRTSLGVGLGFFTIAAGQALGAPAFGRLVDLTDPTGLFCAWGGLSLASAALRPHRRDQPEVDRKVSI